MIKINIAPDKGGSRSFESLNDARAWILEEARLFDGMIRTVPQSSFVAELDQMLTAWSVVERKTVEAYQAYGDECKIDAPTSLVTVDSIAGKAIYDVASKLDAFALRGAIYSANVPVIDIDWSRLDTIAGMQAYGLFADRHREEDQNTIPPALRAKLFEFEQQIDNFRSRMLAVNSDVTQTAKIISTASQSAEEQISAMGSKINLKIAEYDTEIANITSKYLQFEASNADHINGHSAKLEGHIEYAQARLATHDEKVIKKLDESLDDARTKLEAWSNVQMEKVQLEAPVRLWGKRSATHRRAARNLGWASLGAGAVGTAITPVVWYAAFNGAKSLLETPPITRPAIAGNATGKIPLAATAGAEINPVIRPTLHFELIFAGAATLFWLTMFFWLLRLLVRRYTSELRLSTDASGRAAMAQTYLGLTQKGAATEAERPIILGALFQPVTDGATSDDGPPSTSMASIVAAIVAGKN